MLVGGLEIVAWKWSHANSNNGMNCFFFFKKIA